MFDYCRGIIYLFATTSMEDQTYHICNSVYRNILQYITTNEVVDYSYYKLHYGYDYNLLVYIATLDMGTTFFVQSTNHKLANIFAIPLMTDPMLF